MTNDKLEPEIEEWTKIAGKLTQVRFDNRVLVLNPDRPDDLDPIKVLKDFMVVYDLGQTALLRKTGGNTTTTSNVEQQTKQIKPSRQKMERINEDPVSRINNIPIYKSKIIEFYKLVMENRASKSDMAKWNVDSDDIVFKSQDLTNFLYKSYDNITRSTAINRQHVYIKYLEDEKFIELVGGSINRGRVYKFTRAPFGCSVKVQFDDEYMQKMRQLEMYTRRDGIRV